MTAFRVRVRAVALLWSCVAALLAGPMVLAAPADAQAGRSLTIEPAAGLGNQVVTVRWSGFHPTEGDSLTVSVFQCAGAVPASLADCNQRLRPPAEYVDDGTGVTNAVTQADGTGTVLLEVRPATLLPALGCSSGSPCSIVAFENDGEAPTSALPSTAVTAPIGFAPSPADCPRVDTPDVTTAGEGSTAHALYSWSARLCTGQGHIALDYTESSSPDGRDNFLTGLIDVGLTSMPATTAEAATSERTFTYAPVDLSGVVVGFTATDTLTGQRITEMNLTPRLVAIMIAGNPGSGEALFSDPEFVRLNPGHAWPSATYQPLLRAERNADAYLLTRWLDTDAAARAFLDGNDPDASVDGFWKNIDYPTDIFESLNPSYIGSYGPRTGTLANVRRLFIGQGSADEQLPRLDVGTLGVLDAVTARKFGITVAKLRPANDADGAFVAPDAAGLTAGYGAMQSDATSHTKSADVAAAGGYPLVKVDYAMVPTKGVTTTKAAAIARFIDYARTDGQEAGALSPGYVALPDDLRAQAEAASKAVVDGAKVPPPPPPPPPPGADSPLGPPNPQGGPGGNLTPQDPGSFPNDTLGGTDLGGATGPGGTSLTPDTLGDGTTVPSVGANGGPGVVQLAGSAQRRPIAAFAGGDNQGVLPVVLGAGAAALAVGPALTLSGGRAGRAARRLLRRPKRSGS